MLNSESLCVWLLSPHSNQIEQRHLSLCYRRLQTLGQFDPNSQTMPRVYFSINPCSDLKLMTISPIETKVYVSHVKKKKTKNFLVKIIKISITK